MRRSLLLQIRGLTASLCPEGREEGQERTPIPGLRCAALRTDKRESLHGARGMSKVEGNKRKINK